MRNLALFVEDHAQEAFLKAMVRRLGEEHQVEIQVQPHSARGGAGKAVKELRRFLRDLERGARASPDLLIVGRDANCQGHLKRRQELEAVVSNRGLRVVYAIPDPHIERWLLLDSSAFKAVLGRGCSAPARKCERKLYKRLLVDAMRAAGVVPPLGGIEYTEALVHAMDLPFLEAADESLGRLLKDLRTVFQGWKPA